MSRRWIEVNDLMQKNYRYPLVAPTGLTFSRFIFHSPFPLLSSATIRLAAV